MADAPLTGHWKGLLVFRKLHSEVHAYFEQNGTKLIGTFEAPGLKDQDSKGEFTGSIGAGNEVTLALTTSQEVEFRGELSGQSSRNEMLFGVVIALDEIVGTLTLFARKEHGIVLDRY